MKLALLTTCMGRLATLMTVAPTVRAELATRDGWIVVDWSCPDRAGDYLERLGDRRIRVLRHPGERYFHKTRALGLALERARELGTTHVCQLDADSCPRPGFRAELGRLLEPGCFVVAAMRPGAAPQRADSLTGLLALETREAERLELWHPGFRGYGCEDYWARLACLIGGLRPRELRRSFVEPLEHSDREREAHQRDRLQLTWTRNLRLMYRLARERTGGSLRDLPGAARCLNRPGSSF